MAELGDQRQGGRFRALDVECGIHAEFLADRREILVELGQSHRRLRPEADTHEEWALSGSPNWALSTMLQRCSNRNRETSATMPMQS